MRNCGVSNQFTFNNKFKYDTNSDITSSISLFFIFSTRNEGVGHLKYANFLFSFVNCNYLWLKINIIIYKDDNE
jgi:hypothetical protein